MHRGACWTIVHGVVRAKHNLSTKQQQQLYSCYMASWMGQEFGREWLRVNV